MNEKRVLVIDDEKRMADSLKALLETEGYQVRTAYGGAEAIRILETRAFPVIITDLRMQDVDGLAVIRHVSEHHPRTLIIVVTGYASADSAIEALHYHAFDYIRKPFDFDRIKGALERAFHKLEMDQLREDTAAMITHDIKLPLTSIIGFATLLYDPRTGEFSPRAQEFVETIQTNGQKILALIDNYLTSFKVETGNLVVQSRVASVSDFIGGLLQIYDVEAQRKGFVIEADESDAPEKAAFDENLLFRAVGNLLQNALKYGDPVEPIRLVARRAVSSETPLAKEALALEVVNRATDLPEGNLDELFERFKRAPVSSGIEGSGIGLYVVHAVARAHGGLTQARCMDEGRVCFSIILPLKAG